MSRLKILGVIGAFLALTACGGTTGDASLIDAQRLSLHTRTLASNAFAGRAPGTAGETKTVAYIIEQLRAFGVEPAGEGGGYAQPVQMNRYTLAEPPTLTVNGARPGCQLAFGADDVVVFTRRPEPQVDIRSAPLVFVGYGVDAPHAQWNDYAGIDMRGKIAVVLANDPDHEAKRGPFEGHAMTYYGRLSYKAEEAARKGALAVLTINHPQASGYEWPFVRSLYGGPALDIQRADEKRVAFGGWLKQESAERMFACAGQDLEALRQAASHAGFRAVPLADLALSTRFAVQIESSRTQNVIGVVRGSEHADESFVYTAHWDHLGQGEPDSSGDAIYNGAMDNAAGVAGLLELARAFASHAPPRRSVVFIATTLEESGLLGSEYYATHPRFALEKTVGGINLDSLNVFGPTATLEVTGFGKTTLEDLLAEELRWSGRQIRPDPSPRIGFYFRSDHFPFVKRGVPFLFAGSGWELADQKFPNLRDPKMGTRYHQPSDEWSPQMDFEAAARDIRLYYNVGRQLVDSDAWPEWKTGVEWKAVREVSAGARHH